jgi:copper chaperone NosL
MTNPTTRARVLLLTLLALVLSACAAGPQAAHWGVEECAHCRMVIGDERFAGQVVDRRGKAYKFDALECMAAYLNESGIAEADVHSTWIASGRDGWIRVEDAAFLHSDALRSPMGGGYSGYASIDAARAVQEQVGGEILTWQEVRQRATDHAHGDHADPTHAGHAGHTGGGAH